MSSLCTRFTGWQVYVDCWLLWEIMYTHIRIISSVTCTPVKLPPHVPSADTHTESYNNYWDSSLVVGNEWMRQCTAHPCSILATPQKRIFKMLKEGLPIVTALFIPPTERCKERGHWANVFCFLSSLHLLSPATTTVFGSICHLSIDLLLSNTVSPVSACLSIWLERFPGTQKRRQAWDLLVFNSSMDGRFVSCYRE